ncbi:MAG: PLP-dependent cysteine synthase family protein [Mycobacteriales bacterium]
MTATSAGTAPRSDHQEASDYTILAGIGATPMVFVDGVWAKCEFLNPSGSIKARIAHWMVVHAEREGLLRPGDVIVEATSGNTGNALAMVAAVKGYRMVVVMPSGLSPERAAISRAYGAEVRTVGSFHVADARTVACELGEQPGWFCPRQFDSEANSEENREWLAREILGQLPDGAVPDAVVMGVGTGGTLVGLTSAFRKVNPDLLAVAVEPRESCTLGCGEVCQHVIEGIADGFVPGIFTANRHLVDRILSVSGREALAEMRRLASRHGLLVGPSSGAHVAAARQIALTHPHYRHIVTVLCDEGEKYLSQYWI